MPCRYRIFLVTQRRFWEIYEGDPTGVKAFYLLFRPPILAGHHEPLFDFDERVLRIDIDIFSHSLPNV